MNIPTEQIFEQKQMLQTQMHELEPQLHAVIQKQAEAKHVEVLAQLILEYNRLEREIEDRSRVFSLLSSPQQSLRSPFVKAHLFDAVVAAETVSAELVDFLVDDLLIQLRGDVQSGQDNAVDLIQAEYKEYIIPGKIMAGRFDMLNQLLEEMNRFCSVVDAAYQPSQAEHVLEYAFKKAIDADVRMPPIVNAIKEYGFQYLTEDARARLLSQVDERLAVLRFDEARKLGIAMAAAVHMRAEQEAASEGATK